MPCKIVCCQCGKKYLPQRFIVITLVSLSLLITHTQRILFDLVLAEMGKKASRNNTSECNVSGKNKTENRVDEGVWTEYQQRALTDTFLIGYVLMQIPGGYIGDRFGARYIFTVSLLISSVVAASLGLIVDYAGHSMLIAARFLQGFSQANLYPNAATLISKWVRPKDKARATGCTYSIIGLGYVFSRKNGFLYSCVQSWRLMFYVWGSLGFGCSIFCLGFLFSDPLKHPCISPHEKELLSEEIGYVEHKADIAALCPGMFFDAAVVCALILTQIAHELIFFFAVTYIPRFYEDVFHVEMAPWDDFEWILLVVGFSSGIIADLLIYRKKRKLIKVRRAYIALGSSIPGVCLVSFTYVGCSRMGICISRVLALVTLSFYYSGLRTNVLDVTKNFSGTLMAFLGTVGSIIQFFFQNIVDDMAPNSTLVEWRLIMWIPLVLGVAATLIFTVLASGERRKWDKINE